MALPYLPPQAVNSIALYNAALNGTTDDTAAFAAAYAATPSGGTIFIPAGANLNVATQPHAANKSVMYSCAGTFDYGTNDAGQNPVQSFGDGDVLVNFYANRLNFNKTCVTSQSYTTVFVGLANNTTQGVNAYNSVISSLVVQGSSGLTSSGSVWPLNVVLYSGSQGATNVVNEEVAISSKVIKNPGSSVATWQFLGQTIDETGLPANTGSSFVIAEYDTSASGPESSITGYEWSLGARCGLHLEFGTYTCYSWTATTAVSLYAAWTSNPGNSYTYICTQGGTTGSTQPTWPTSNTSHSISSITWSGGIVTVVTATAYQTGLTAGNTFYFQISGCTPSAYNVSSILGSPTLGTVVNATTFTFPLANNPGTETVLGTVLTGIVADGTAIWCFGTTSATQVSRAIDVGGAAQVGAVYTASCAVYSAIADFSFATLVSQYSSKPAAIRLASNMPIDFSANGTLAGQNVRTLLYNSTSGNLEYQKSGSVVAAITDLGGLIIGGTSTEGIDVVNAGGIGINFTDGTPGVGIRFAANTAGQNIEWLYEGTPLTLSVTYPNFVFSAGVLATTLGASSLALTNGVTYNQIVNSGNFVFQYSSTNLFSVSQAGVINLQGTGAQAIEISSTNTVGIDFTPGTFAQAIKLNASTAGQEIAWNNSGSFATISVTWPNFIFSADIVVPALILGTATGPQDVTGTGVPTATLPKGSTFRRTDGGVGSTLYVTQGGGTWNAVSGV